MNTRNRRSWLPAAATMALALILASACSSGTDSNNNGSSTGKAPGSVATGSQGGQGAQGGQEPIEISSLPLPPTAPSETPGSCTHPTGCLKASDEGIAEGPGYTWDGHHVLLPIEFAGAAAGSPYSGSQVIAIKTDGTTFPGGDPYKCVTCGVPDANKAGANTALDHPQAFHDGKRILAGTNIVDCSPHLLVDADCTPETTHIYPLWWQVTADGSGKAGNMRELRLNPDDVHLGWSHIILSPQLAEPAFMGRLVFDPNPTGGTPQVPRYELSNVTALQSTDPAKSGTFLSVDPKDSTKLVFDEPAGVIGEFRGWTSDGKDALGIGLYDSANYDIFATDLQTAQSRRLSYNPAYVDPVKTSPDDNSSVIMDSRVDDRMMFIAGLPGVPPVIDQLDGVPFAISGMRNNGNRRFFEPYLLDRDGDQGDDHGRQLNACGPNDDPAPGSGSICDPLWNGRADPAWSPDGSSVVYWQALVTAPACGGGNPLACPDSREPGGRRTRLMVAKLTGRTPGSPTNVAPVPDAVPWGIPYHPGDPFPMRSHLPAGTYTLAGKRSGTAQVTIVESPDNARVSSVRVTYKDYTNDGVNMLNGTERGDNANGDAVTWHEDLTLTGQHTGAKKTSEPAGFAVSVGVSALAASQFEATGTITTVLDGHTYTQPANHT